MKMAALRLGTGGDENLGKPPLAAARLLPRGSCDGFSRGVKLMSFSISAREIRL